MNNIHLDKFNSKYNGFHDNWEEEKHYSIMCCLFSCPIKRILARTGEKKEEARKGVQPPVQCLQSYPLHSRLFSALILFRTMLLPIIEDTMQIMIMMMKIVIN